MENRLHGVSTEVFAGRFLVKPKSVIVRLCTHGSYHGIKPLKLPNGRLLWPDLNPADDLRGGAQEVKL